MTENRNAIRNAIIDEMLQKATTVAVVGISNKPERASYNIANYLAKHGYRVVPVNPALSEVVVNGATLTCYPTLEDAQVAVAVDWLQDGVQHDEAIAKAEAAGVKCIQNDCIFREHAARV
jgi:predicted CoA-binding protein